MGMGIDWILMVAGFVSGMDGSVIYIPKPETIVLPLLVFGSLFTILWRGKMRVIGLCPAIFYFVIWGQSHRPDVLLSANGRLLGVMSDAGRVLNREKGNGFAARSWLENDGDGAVQAASFARLGFQKVGKNFTYLDGDIDVRYYWGKDVDSNLETIPCKTNLILITPQWDGYNGACNHIDKVELKHLGAISINRKALGLSITGARPKQGARPWVP